MNGFQDSCRKCQYKINTISKANLLTINVPFEFINVDIQSLYDWPLHKTFKIRKCPYLFKYKDPCDV